MSELCDRLGRPIRDLRISVTDRCNFRCTYCMPRAVFDSHRFLPRAELLSFEEIARLVGQFSQLGVRKLRLTGGEPLLRSNLERLIESLAMIDGIEDIALTTNASLMTAERARSLRDAGLKRVNISLDALDSDVFKAISDVDIPVQQVLDGIAHCVDAGFDQVKVNMVVKKGVNGDSVLPMANHFRGTGVILRFIEFMDVGNSNGWDASQVLSGEEIINTIGVVHPLSAVEPHCAGEVAKRWEYADGAGEIGVVTSVTQPFCGSCHRARLSAVGQLYTCLFGSAGHDLRGLLRSGVDDEHLQHRIASIWSDRADRYSEQRGRSIGVPSKVEMSYIGG